MDCISQLAEYLNSNFITAIVGSLAGAFFGAWGAQKIAENAKRKDELIEEIRNVNMALATSFYIWNMFLNLQSQFLKQMCDEYEERRQSWIQSNNNQDIPMGFDFRIVAPMDLPIALLQTQVFEKLSMKSRAHGAMLTLKESIVGLNIAFEHRTELIHKLRQFTESDKARIFHTYFGTKESNGHYDESFPDVMAALQNHIAGGIFFSAMLCKDLKKYGDEVFLKYSTSYPKDAANISVAHVDLSAGDDFMPDESDFAEWLKVFPEGRCA